MTMLSKTAILFPSLFPPNPCFSRPHSQILSVLSQGSRVVSLTPGTPPGGLSCFLVGRTSWSPPLSETEGENLLPTHICTLRHGGQSLKAAGSFAVYIPTCLRCWRRPVQRPIPLCFGCPRSHEFLVSLHKYLSPDNGLGFLSSGHTWELFLKFLKTRLVKELGIV